jgi:hypothetical protein
MGFIPLNIYLASESFSVKKKQNVFIFIFILNVCIIINVFINVV